ncbi:MAG TPA: DUF3460 family protein [Usitatibacter sp.]|nr:DUF3460 family protein [Usitatibacter sp.]
MYESEITRFLRDFVRKNPQVGEQQKKNRLTWWDRPQDMDTWKERRQAAVPQAAYVYFPLPKRGKEDDPDSGDKLSDPARPG